MIIFELMYENLRQNQYEFRENQNRLYRLWLNINIKLAILESILILYWILNVMVMHGIWDC